MSILIDDRGHKPPLLPYFRPYGVLAEPTLMESSDIFFVGNGPAGNCNIGIERKKIADLAGSIRSERLSGFQLDGLMEYDYPMLLVEGIWRSGTSGELECMSNGGFKPYYCGQQSVLYREISNFLCTMQLLCGVTVIRTASPEETAAFVSGLYFWFTKDWHEHRAHLGIYAPVPDHPDFVGKKLPLMRRPKASLVTKMAAQIPGLDQRSWKVGEYFQTPLEMVVADERTWQEIEGIGKKGAKKIVEALQNVG